MSDLNKTKADSATPFSAENNFDYVGEDLDQLKDATNYFNLVLNKFDKYIGKEIIELGAGNGNFTKIIHSRYPDSILTACEPAPTVFKKLEEKMYGKSNVDLKQGFLSDFDEEEKYDTAIYSNVLEHIKDDVQEMKNCYKVLKKGGYICTYSPALMSLYCQHDKNLGHYRRYTLEEKKSKLELAGFKVVEGYYHDFYGMLVMWLKYKALRVNTLDDGNVMFYFNTLLPIIDKIDPAKLLNIGKNIFVIAQK